MAEPITIANAVDIQLRPHPRSASKPIMTAEMKNPARYPPVVPIIYTMPAPPANTGAPAAPAPRYPKIVTPPKRAP